MLFKNTIWQIINKKTRKNNRLSEDQNADLSHLSRTAIRHIEAHESSISIQSLSQACRALDLKTAILSFPQSECNSDYSTYAVSIKTLNQGESSWKIHFMELVDEFRKSFDPRLLILPPTQQLPLQLKALLASIVCDLSLEAEIDAPTWATKNYYLDQPWFVSEFESLKASALLESPWAFRKNNIFVQSNFLNRV